MTEDKFINRNEGKWKELEAYAGRLYRRGAKSLTRGEAREFARLFRLAGSHLAYANTRFPGGRAAAYLNGLAGAAHNHFYTREPEGVSNAINYIRFGFSVSIRRRIFFLISAAAFFFAGALFAGIYTFSVPSFAANFFPQTPGFGGAGAWYYPLMSAVVMSNNVRVSMLAFALGIFGGVGTAYVLFYNGMLIGALAAYAALSGYNPAEFYSLILPHGVLELSAVFLSGACGLMNGKAVLIPGKFSRKDALVSAAKESAALLPGVAAMLVIAGLIEGFFTPLPIMPPYKLIFAGLTLIGFVLYILLPKDKSKPAPRLKR